MNMRNNLYDNLSLIPGDATTTTIGSIEGSIKNVHSGPTCDERKDPCETQQWSQRLVAAKEGN